MSLLGRLAGYIDAVLKDVKDKGCKDHRHLWLQPQPHTSKTVIHICSNCGASYIQIKHRSF